MKASALIFSKDDTEQAIELASEIHDAFDETVVMDASGKRGKKYLLEGKNRLGLKRLRIFNVIALGFREPLMMYALTKCRNEWVIVFNTDEKPSDSLASDLPRLISNPGCDAYSIPVYSVHSAKSRTFVSSQIRLFKKHRIEFRGLLHEQPIVHGNFLELTGKEYYIDHMTAGKVHTTRGGYAEMERFQRYTYKEYNTRMLEMYDRARRIYSLDRKTLSPTKRLIHATLKLYQSLGLKSQEQEASNFDYFLYVLARDISHQIRRRRLRGVLEALPNAAAYAKKMGAWRSADTADEDFGIASKINKIGTVKFIGLDSADVVERLDKKYMDKKQGIGLLIRLLRERYRNESKKSAPSSAL